MGENLERENENLMDTPVKDQIKPTLSKFEDSPVFNYISNLSPLETVRPVRISQTFNSYNFSAVPSIFASPHVSSLKETTLLRRHSVSDPTIPTCSSEKENKICRHKGFVDIPHEFEGKKEIYYHGGCVDESCKKGHVENEPVQNQNYGFHVPNDNAVTCHDKEQNRDKGSFNWSSSDVADFLIFESPNNANSFTGSFLKPLDSESRLPVLKKTLDDGFVEGGLIETENTLPQIDESHLNATKAGGNVLALTCINNQASEVPNEGIVNESACNLPRGIRRRCLVYDIGGARRKFLDDGSSSSSPTLLKCHVTSSENNNSSRCIVPGIGLHLNALARTPKVYTANNQGTLASSRQLMNDLSSNAPDKFVNTQETINQNLALNSMDRDVIPNDGGDLSQGSPKKKKLKEENGGEAESCKRCNCKKSKCLKLYCECFAAGVYCVEPCSCQDCFNKPIHEDIVLATRKQIESRNPLAFAPKVIRTTDVVPETVDESSNTPASARHKRGCNCKKSGCLKKYCECYQGGVGCSINCRCEGCKNAFGRKDGTHIVLPQAEVEETENHERSVVDRNLSKHIIQINAEQYPDSAFPETPMHSNRTPHHHPLSSKNKPPRALLATGSSSSSLYGGQKFGIPAFLKPHTKLEKQYQTNTGNEIPEILLSPISGIKSTSPNSKRVSSPHSNFKSSLSPSRMSSRKLILQSIPSFPSLKD